MAFPVNYAVTEVFGDRNKRGRVLGLNCGCIGRITTGLAIVRSDRERDRGGLTAPDSGGGFRYIMCRIWIYDRARYVTGSPLAWQLDDNNASERLGRFGVAGKGGELGEHLDGRRHHKCGVVAVRARFERRRNRFDRIILSWVIGSPCGGQISIGHTPGWCISPRIQSR
jgi:hypothetical protein